MQLAPRHVEPQSSDYDYVPFRPGPKPHGGVVAAIATAAVLVAGGTYVYADIQDRVPGFLTMAPPDPTAAPFPTPLDPGVGTLPAQLIPPLSEDAPLPSPTEVARLISNLTADPRLGPHVGVVIVDVATGQVLGEANADEFFVPASTQKMLTALAAAEVLDQTATLDTRVLLDGNRLVLVGGGDMLLAGGYGDPEAVLGHAGLADLADQTVAALHDAGRTEVQLEFDDTLFGEPRVAPEVPPGEVAGGFIAHVASMAINLARLTDAEISPTSPDPALATAQAFAELLTARGITLTGPVAAGQAGETAQEIARVASAPLGDVIEWAMLRSENTITEVLGRLVAISEGQPATTSGSIQAVEDVVERLGLDLTGGNLVDLSGLGRGSLLTPRQLLSSITTALDPAQPQLRSVAAHLPIGNLTGTLFDRYPGENPARGLVRAKTGSLPGVTALSGTVVTTSQRQLAFVIVADQTPSGGQWAPRQAMDSFVGQLAALGEPSE